MTPPKSVIYESLLYWDGISTIVPSNYRDVLNEDMRMLTDGGMYTPILGKEILSDHDFGSWAIFRLYHLGLGGRYDSLVPDKWRDYSLTEPMDLQLDKIPDDMVFELQKLGLATVSRDAGLLRTTSGLGLSLLSLVARRVCDDSNGAWGLQHEQSLYPCTSDRTAFSIAHRPGLQGQNEDFIQLDLSRLLPVPREDVLLADLIAFREKYGDERRRLFSAITKLLYDLTSYATHPEDVARLARSEIEASLADLNNAARQRNINWAARTLLVGVALYASYIGSESYPNLEWILGVLGGLAVNAATGSMRRVTSDGTRHSGFTYLHLVSKAIPK